MKRLHIVQNVDSTNAELARRLPLPHGYGLMAREQTHGRGRQDRVWQCLPGDLAASWWVVHVPDPITALPLVVGLAVHDALCGLAADCGRSLSLGCKWPNDLRVQGKKLVGILAAYHADHGGAVVGVGVNLTATEDDLRELARPVTSFFLETGVVVTADRVFCVISRALARRLRQWRREGFVPLREAWLARCDHLRAFVRVHGPGGGVVEGITEGVGDFGELLLRRGDFMEKVYAGDLAF